MLSNGHFLLNVVFVFAFHIQFFFHSSFVFFPLFFRTRYCNFVHSFVLRYFFICVQALILGSSFLGILWKFLDSLKNHYLCFWRSVPHFLLNLNGASVQVIYTVISVVYVFIIACFRHLSTHF